MTVTRDQAQMLTDLARADEQVRLVEQAMATHALEAWRSANARQGLSDHEALIAHADALTRWSERLRMALRGDIDGDEEWLR